MSACLWPPMSPPANPTDEDELDFTREPAAPAPAPTPAQAAEARAEAKTGTPQLEKSGFYVSIARRSPLMIPPRNGEKYSLLVVEDDPDLAQLVIDIFMTAGFEVRWAADRAEANRELHRAGIDLVLLDIVLPDADGLQILRRIREHPRLGDLPVIMMTGKVAPEDVLAGLAAGADGYVTKPFRMSGLVNAVNVVLGTA